MDGASNVYTKFLEYVFANFHTVIVGNSVGMHW